MDSKRSNEVFERERERVRKRWRISTFGRERSFPPEVLTRATGGSL